MSVDMHSQPTLDLPRWQRLVSDSVAGLLTAFVFYAEYASLGAYLGEQWPGSTSAAKGALAVLGAVVLASLLSLAQKRAILSGPRAASLAVLVGGIATVLRTNPDPIRAEDVATVTLAGMLIVAGSMQCLGRVKWIRTGIHALPLPVRKGFMFATAIGIVTGLASHQLNDCLVMNPTATTAIAAAGLLAYFGWITWVERTGARLRVLLPLGIPVAATVATIGYYSTVAASARGVDHCGTLGTSGLAWSSLMIMPKVFDGAIARAHVSTTAVAMMMGFGVALGIVMLLESLTTLTDSEAAVPDREWSRVLTISSIANVLCAVLGFSCHSLSTSRTNSLIEGNGRTSVAVIVHGLVLLVVSLVLVEWVGKLPQLTIAVVLMIVAVQMIDRGTRRDIWSDGFASNASPASTRTTWGFIGFVVAAVVIGLSATLLRKPFSSGVVVALILSITVQATFWLAARRSQRRFE